MKYLKHLASLLLFLAVLMVSACMVNQDTMIQTTAIPEPTELPADAVMEIPTDDSGVKDIESTATRMITTPTLQRTATPIYPTPDSSYRVKELIKMGNSCDLPCFWGVTPGQTKWLDAVSHFRMIGMSNEGLSDFFGYLEKRYLYENEGISVEIAMYKNEDIVGAMIVSFFSMEPAKFDQGLVDYFSLPVTFREFAYPGEMMVMTENQPEGEIISKLNHLWLDYSSDGFQLDYAWEMQPDDNDICVDVPFDFMSLYIKPDDSKIFPWDFGTPGESLEFYDVVQLNGKQIVDQVMSVDGNPCFDMKSESTTVQ